MTRLVACLLVASIPASAQWTGFVDRSSELNTTVFSFRDSRPEMVNGNQNYYDGDFADFDRDGRNHSDTADFTIKYRHTFRY